METNKMRNDKFLKRNKLPYLGNEGAKSFEEANLLIAGTGFVGEALCASLVINNFCSKGVLCLIDKDSDILPHNVAKSNLLTENDIGAHSKVNAIAAHLQFINPNTNINAIEGDVSFDIGLGYLNTFDMVISCLDNDLAKVNLLSRCKRLQIPALVINVDSRLMQISLRFYSHQKNDKIGSYCCSLLENDFKKIKIHTPCARKATAENESAPELNSIGQLAGVFGANEIIKYYLPKLKEKVPFGYELRIDLMEHHIDKLKLPSSADSCILYHPFIDKKDIVKVDYTVDEILLGDLCDLAANISDSSDINLIFDKSIAITAVCNICGAKKKNIFKTIGCLSLSCECDGELEIIESARSLIINSLPSEILSRPLTSLNLPSGELIEVSKGERGEKYYLEI